MMDAATQRKDSDTGKGRGGGRLRNLAHRVCSPGGVGVRSDQVSVAFVVVVSGIDRIGECKATDAWLLVGLECTVAVSNINQSASAAPGNNVRDSITVDIGKMRIRWDVGGISHGCLEGTITVPEEDEEAVANEAATWLCDGSCDDVGLTVTVGIPGGKKLSDL